MYLTNLFRCQRMNRLQPTVVMGVLTVVIAVSSHAAADTIQVPQDHQTIQALESCRERAMALGLLP